MNVRNSNSFFDSPIPYDAWLVFDLKTCCASGACSAGGAASEGGGGEEEVWGDGETDSLAARRPARAAAASAATGEHKHCCSEFNETLTNDRWEECCFEVISLIYTILSKVLAPLLMNRFDYFSNFYEYKS